MKGKTVVEITEVSVEAPLVDRSRAWKNRLGVFSKFTTALSWLSRWIAEHGPGEADGLLYYRLDGIVFDVELRYTHTIIFSGDDKRRGSSPATRRSSGADAPPRIASTRRATSWASSRPTSHCSASASS